MGITIVNGLSLHSVLVMCVMYEKCCASRGGKICHAFSSFGVAKRLIAWQLLIDYENYIRKFAHMILRTLTFYRLPIDVVTLFGWALSDASADIDRIIYLAIFRILLLAFGNTQV